ncbi:MAG: hypothetical protein ACI9J5_000976, partial [Paraglaciecola sp.]
MINHTTNDPVRLLLVDDHPMVQGGLSA